MFPPLYAGYLYLLLDPSIKLACPDWFIALFASVVIGQSKYFGFGYATLIENRSKNQPMPDCCIIYDLDIFMGSQNQAESMGAFFWDYSGIGLLGIDGIRVLLGSIPFSELTEYNSVHSAPDSRMNRMNGLLGIRRIRVLLENFWREIQRGRPRRSPGFRLEDVIVLRSSPP